jgi:hypothetical protein
MPKIIPISYTTKTEYSFVNLSEPFKKNFRQLSFIYGEECYIYEFSSDSTQGTATLYQSKDGEKKKLFHSFDFGPEASKYREIAEIARNYCNNLRAKGLIT